MITGGGFDEARNFALFWVGDCLFAVLSDMLSEVIPVKDILPFPCEDDTVLGAVKLRGTLTPLISAVRLCGLATDKAQPETAIIARQGDQVFALAVDRVAGIRKVKNQEIQTISGGTRHGYTEQFTLPSGENAIIVDLNRLFALDDVPRATKPVSAKNAGAARRGEHPHLTFQCGDTIFAISISKLFNTFPSEDLAAQDMANDTFLGMSSYLGRKVPVINTTKVLNLRQDSAERAKEIVVVHMGEDRLLGLAVDRILQIDYFSTAAFVPVPPQLRSATPLIKATVTAAQQDKAFGLDGKKTLILDVDAFSGNAELVNVAALSRLGTEETQDHKTPRGAIIRERERTLVLDAGRRFGAPVAGVVRIVSPPATVVAWDAPVPGLRGFFFFQGKMLPYVTLSEHLGLAASETQHNARVLICGSEETRCGFWVENIVAVTRSAWRSDPNQRMPRGQDMVSVPKLGKNAVLTRLDLAEEARTLTQTIGQLHASGTVPMAKAM